MSSYIERRDLQFARPDTVSPEKLALIDPDAMLNTLAAVPDVQRGRELQWFVSHPAAITSPWPAPLLRFRATRRSGRSLVEFIRATIDEAYEHEFLVEVAYAAAESIAANDLWPVAETLNSWELTAEVEGSPELSADLHEAIQNYEQGREMTPWRDVAEGMGLDGD